MTIRSCSPYSYSRSPYADSSHGPAKTFQSKPPSSRKHQPTPPLRRLTSHRSDAVFQLAGVFALILFLTTRSLIPATGTLTWWFAPRPKLSAEALEHGVQPYHVQDFVSAHGFNSDKVDLERAESFQGLADPPATPTRPPRPDSLPPLPPLPPIPPTPAVAAPHQSYRTTAYTVGSRYTQDDAEAYAEAWDEVDLRRATAELERMRDEADDVSMRFTLSAYEYEAGRDGGRGEEDDRYLSTLPAQTPRRSYLDSASYLDAYVNFDMVTPEPPAQRPVNGRPF